MDFFARFLRLPYKLMAAVFSNPMGMFIYGIFAKWYIVVSIASIVVLYWVLKGLESTGILNAAFNTMLDVLNSSKAIAKNCTPKIINLQDFWYCLSNPGAYEPNIDEQNLNSVGDQLQNLIDQNSSSKPIKPVNPYSR
jgi:hypothetical protein